MARTLLIATAQLVDERKVGFIADTPAPPTGRVGTRTVALLGLHLGIAAVLVVLSAANAGQLGSVDHLLVHPGRGRARGRPVHPRAPRRRAHGGARGRPGRAHAATGAAAHRL